MIRIISGTHKSRVIHAPKNLPVRPTTDFAKESLFNILNNNYDFADLKVLDLFCGTGNITYEFISRGCTSIIAVDESFLCTSFVKKTLEALKMTGAKVVKADVFSFLKNSSETYHVIFADPPYEMENFERIPTLVFEHNLLRENGMLIVEHGPRTDLSSLPHFKDVRKYGNANFSFFE